MSATASGPPVVLDLTHVRKTNFDAAVECPVEPEDSEEESPYPGGEAGASFSAALSMELDLTSMKSMVPAKPPAVERMELPSRVGLRGSVLDPVIECPVEPEDSKEESPYLEGEAGASFSAAQSMTFDLISMKSMVPANPPALERMEPPFRVGMPGTVLDPVIECPAGHEHSLNESPLPRQESAVLDLTSMKTMVPATSQASDRLMGGSELNPEIECPEGREDALDESPFLELGAEVDLRQAQAALGPSRIGKVILQERQPLDKTTASHCQEELAEPSDVGAMLWDARELHKVGSATEAPVVAVDSSTGTSEGASASNAPNAADAAKQMKARSLSFLGDEAGSSGSDGSDSDILHNADSDSNDGDGGSFTVIKSERNDLLPEDASQPADARSPVAEIQQPRHTFSEGDVLVGASILDTEQESERIPQHWSAEAVSAAAEYGEDVPSSWGGKEDAGASRLILSRLDSDLPPEMHRPRHTLSKDDMLVGTTVVGIKKETEQIPEHWSSEAGSAAPLDASLEPGVGAEARSPEASKPPPPKPAPKRIVGHLWKQSPSMLKMWKYQHRYIEVRDMKLFWWKSKKEAQAAKFGKALDGGEESTEAQELQYAGMIDLGLTPCVVEVDQPNDSKAMVFLIRPREGEVWKGATFTGGDKSRVFTFDATDSENSLAEWIDAFTDHISYAGW